MFMCMFYEVYICIYIYMQLVGGSILIFKAASAHNFWNVILPF